MHRALEAVRQPACGKSEVRGRVTRKSDAVEQKVQEKIIGSARQHALGGLLVPDIRLAEATR